MNDRWHWGMMVGALTSAGICVWALYSANEPGNDQSAALAHSAIGIAGLILVTLSAWMTRFWTRYDSAGAGVKALTWLVLLPGAGFLIFSGAFFILILALMLFLLYLVVTSFL